MEIAPKDDAGPRILIVDDDVGTCETLADVLRARGQVVLAATSGGEGLRILARHPVDVAIVDVKLPDMSGLELLDAIKKASPHTVVIVVTAHASIDTAIQAVNRAAFAYIEKPFEMDHVLSTIRGGLEGANLARALHESEERYRLVTEHIHDAVFLFDLDGRVTFATPRIEELTG
jgi:DNA-binding NtrC family response regulator